MRYLRTLTAWMALVALGAALGACATFGERPEPPEVSLSQLRVVEIGLLEQRLGLRLRVQNPNRFVLPIEGLRFDLAVNERAFAQGVSNEAVTIPALGEAFVDVQAVTSLTRLLEHLQSWRDRSTLSYRLSGSLSLKRRVNPLPFDISGEIATPEPPKLRRAAGN